MRSIKIFRAALALVAVCSTGYVAAAETCSLVLTNLNFGTYDPLSATGSTAMGSVGVRCNKTTNPSETLNYSITMSAGKAGTYKPNRTMTGPGGTLVYQIYRDSAFTAVWGNTTSDDVGGSQFLPSGQYPITGDFTVYGKVPGSQDVGVGAYTDSVVVTLNF